MIPPARQFSRKFAPDAAVREQRARRRGATRQCELLEARELLDGDPLIDLPGVDEAALVSTIDVGTAADAVLAMPLTIDAEPLTGSATPGGFTPEELLHAYGFDQIFFDGGSIVGDGSGQTIAIVSAYHTPTAAADLASFSTYFGLPSVTSFVQVDQYGGTNYPASSAAWAQETALDVQWIHAFAPGADILLVEAASASFTNLTAAVNYARQQPNVSVVSMSWGSAGEFSNELTDYDSIFTTPVGHDGVTFVAAAGNSGGPGGYPAYSANVLAVGGTRLVLDTYGNISSETAWTGSGGGLSQYTPQPSWQNGVVTQSATKRGMPDVAFDANPSTGVPVYDTFNNSVGAPWTKLGGTSFATLAWAGLVAIANQGRELAGLDAFDIPTLMNALYSMPASNFNDIVSGASGGTIPQTAGPGYDLVTGRGSPKAALVVDSLMGTATVSGTVFNDLDGNGLLGAEPGLAGWIVYADLNNNGAFDAVAVDTFVSTDVGKTISSAGTPTVTSNNLVSGLAGDILDVKLTLNISHTNDADLVITLIAPDGTEVVLARHGGGTSNNFTGTTFDDGAAISIAAGTAPFSGTYKPIDALARLFDKNPNGTWQLRIQDTTNGGGGSLNSWSLEITTGDKNAVTAANGSYVLGGLPSGNYQIRQVNQPLYSQTAPAGTFYSIALSAGQHQSGRNFGDRQMQASVAGRYLFYNQSFYDNNDAAINAADDAAIAGKTAYRSGDGLITAASMSSYVRGINGIMIDLAGGHGPITENDFEFRMSGQGLDANNAPDTWTSAPVHTAFSVRAAAGAGGTDRVVITWADGAIVDRYLRVVFKGNDVTGGFNTNTGLAASDVFFFGNKVGDTFANTPATVFYTSSADEIEARGNFGPSESLNDLYDFDRNGLAGAAADQIASRGHFGVLSRINIGGVPAAPEAAPAAMPLLADEPPQTGDASTPGNAAAPLAAKATMARTFVPRYEPGLMLALATEHWRRLEADDDAAEWLADDVDDPLLTLLAQGRLGRIARG